MKNHRPKKKKLSKSRTRVQLSRRGHRNDMHKARLAIYADPITHTLLSRISEPVVDADLLVSYLQTQDAYIASLESLLLSSAKVPRKSL